MQSSPMSQSAAAKIVRQAQRKGLEWIEEQGYAWFVENLLPAVRSLSPGARSRKDRHVAANAHSLLGDVYDLCFNAPRAALRAYRHCVKLNSNHAWAWGEIGSMLDDVGEYARAKNAYLRALRLNPSGSLIPAHLGRIERDIASPSKPLYVAGDPLWQSAELIAQHKPRKALALLKNKRSVRARQCRARALGALGDSKGVIREWLAISRATGQVELERPDWYMLPEDTWESPEFWKAMAEIRDRLDFSYVLRHESLWEVIPSPPKHRPSSKANLHRCSRRFHWVARYHLARTRRDVGGLEALCKKYPKWTEAAELLAELKKAQ